MKKIKILYKIIIIAMLIVMFNTCICYAETQISTDMEQKEYTTNIRIATITGDTEKGLPNINTNYKPKVDLGTTGTTKNVIETILGALTVISVITVLLAIALIGFNIITGTASEKAVNQEKLIGILIAAAVLTGGTSLIRIIMGFAENI